MFIARPFTALTGTSSLYFFYIIALMCQDIFVGVLSTTHSDIINNFVFFNGAARHSNSLRCLGHWPSASGARLLEPGRV